MSHADIALALILIGLSAYLLFGGADFGAGAWHLIARREPERHVIEHAMGPLWEANHVWLIFVMVMAWTAFPPVFAAVMTAYWVPLSLAALGIVIRGSAFVFHKALPDQGGYAWAFGVSSVLTPYCFGAVAGAIATGDDGGIGSVGWLGVAGTLAGLLTAGLCVYLAAVYLTWDARRLAGGETAERFRSYALWTGLLVGALAVAGAATLDVRSPLIALSGLAGLVSLVLLARRAYLAVRISAALATGAVLWGAASMSRIDLAGAAAHDAVMRVVFVSLGVGAIVLLPSLIWLYVLFQREPGRPAGP